MDFRWLSPSFFLASILAGIFPSLSVAVDFNNDIRPIFTEHCTSCHGGVEQSAGLSFVYRDSVVPPDGWVVEPSDPDASELIARVTAEDDYRMPPADHGPRLSDEDVAKLREWIEAGAEWQAHWSFVPPERRDPPKSAGADGHRGMIDRFVVARLEREELQLSPPASRREWLRRVTFDLTGLPPSKQQLDDFLADKRPDAFERAVDRLLASPAYGEHWASMWMDLARYADSQGYEKDSLRTMWPYRDWLIRSLNKDVPYDEMTVQQLAGDLLADATLEDRIATAFHRNTLTNSEGGTDDEEFRVVAALDRVATTWEVWQGLTFKCTQCHDHPYEPISHKEYYNFLAYFNTSRDWDRRSDEPRMRVPNDRDQWAYARKIDRETEQLEKQQVGATSARVTSSRWTQLVPQQAHSTGHTELRVQHSDDGAFDIVAEGTVTHNSKFTLTFEVAEPIKRLTALRIDVLPRELETAPVSPEPGFVLSEVTGKYRVNPEQPWQKLSFKLALGDEFLPIADPQRTLRPDRKGWGGEPRITHRRRLVLIPAAPIDLPPDGQLQLVIRQEDAPTDLAAQVMRRSRYAVSDDPAWTEWTSSSDFVERRKRHRELKAERKAMGGTAIPVMQEQQPSLQRSTAVFVRGQWMDKGELVSAGIPEVFNASVQPTDRLQLARWLVSEENPLAARVAVNRYWEKLFGAGIVTTLADFGSTGAPPTHPALLDWLAVHFRDDLDWSAKALLKEMVLSATYRQTSRASAELVERDPYNRLLARGPRNRLTAEMVRDHALVSSGLLNDEMYGPPVYPPQPDGIWKSARSKLTYKESKGDDRYRRALYTVWRRTSPYPSMLTFDAPERLVCSAQRTTTNTPLQALVTLNDPVYDRCAEALAARIANEAGDALEDRLALGYELATSQLPSEEDVRDLKSLYAKALEQYRRDEALAGHFGSAERAALKLVAGALLNLDVALTR